MLSQKHTVGKIILQISEINYETLDILAFFNLLTRRLSMKSILVKEGQLSQGTNNLKA